MIAISNLLQGPIIRTGLLPGSASASTTYKAPTTRDIPPVTLTNIPHIDPTVFRDYLSDVAPLFESYQRGRAELEAQNAQRDADLKKIEEGKEAARRISRDAGTRPSMSRQGSSTMLHPTDSPQPRRRSSAYNRRRANEPTPLSTIPLSLIHI